MLFLSRKAFALGVISAASVSGFSFKRQNSLDNFITNEKPIAKAGLFNNFGPDGSKDHGAASGVVIASPSTDNPNYVFLWIRDSSLVFKYLIDEFTLGRDTSLLPTIQRFVDSQGRLQKVPNPSGLMEGGGLGEPKFEISEEAFQQAWGRPQRDGPALRSTALITLADHLQKNGQADYVSSKLWPMIKLDLDYVALHWNLTTFDLWEEVRGSSFFTTAAHHRSLRMGAKMAAAFGDAARASTYTAQASQSLCFLQSYWSDESKFIVSNVDESGKPIRSGLDANSVLASIHTFDPEAGCDAATFQPCSDKALANHFAFVNSFRSIYTLNSGIPANGAVAVGRYPEDVYFGGNPWYLCTLAPAEQLYDAIHQWNNIGSIPVTSISLPFFKQFLPNAAVGSYASSSSEFATIISAVKNYADGFVSIVQKFIAPQGGLPEQFTRDNGTPISAVDLTWSYASALTAFNARESKFAASWGAKDLSPSCSATGDVTVTFTQTADTVFGENIFLTGSTDALKNFSTDNAIPLSADTYPVWKVTVRLPAHSNFEFKFIRKAANGAVTWESDPNRSFTTGSPGTIVAADNNWR